MTADTLIEYTGILVSNAQVRNRPIDGAGHSVPVVCVQLQMENASHTLINAEQRFDAAQHAQAKAAAHRLTKGVRITLHCTLADMRLFSGNTTHIHLHKPTESPCQP